MMNATDKASPGRQKVFLFLQGPHGPFFAQLAARLTEAGASCWRVAFNAGDAARWTDTSRLLRFTDPQSAWADQFRAWVTETGTTDLVLYGDTRPHHAMAVRLARDAGLVIHVFEEGYLRPYWATYERGGSNGNSRLMEITVDDMARALTASSDQPVPPPDHWGDLRAHMIQGALYHWDVLFRNQAFPHYQPHRDKTVSEEFRLQVLRLLRRPRHIVERWRATRRIRKGGWPYHVVLLQLEHDASFRAFSDFTSQTEFVEQVIAGFANGAPAHHRLVFKAHPLEDGRAPVAATICSCADAYGVTDRVFYVRGGKLAYLLRSARTAVTVNSTAAHQALWRGLPVRIFGQSVYDKPGLVSHQNLPAFFAEPDAPDQSLYEIYRQFLLQSSQLPGGFYSAKARSELLRNVVDRMLSPQDPYDLLLTPHGSEAQHLRVVQ